MQVNTILKYNLSEIESVLVVSHDIPERKLIKLEIAAKNKNINESINYFTRIKKAIIPDTIVDSHSNLSSGEILNQLDEKVNNTLIKELR